jgi:hypothetical protein
MLCVRVYVCVHTCPEQRRRSFRLLRAATALLSHGFAQRAFQLLALRQPHLSLREALHSVEARQRGITQRERFPPAQSD